MDGPPWNAGEGPRQSARLLGHAAPADLLGAPHPRVRLTVSGGADVDTHDLQATHVAVDASGGCDVELTALESIAGEVSGGGSVKVLGHPPNARVQASGGASVDSDE